jgi:hypothetical protein
MFERIKSQIMTRHDNKQREESKWTGILCPKIKKKVEKNVEFSKNSYVDGAGDGLFAVAKMMNATPTEYIVDIKAKTCTCNRWQKCGIPCPHVLSAIRDERIDPLTLADHCYSVELHSKAYANIVHPCKDKSEWEKMNGPTILPPLYQKHVGRLQRIGGRHQVRWTTGEDGKKCQGGVSLCTIATVGLQITISMDVIGSKMV